MLTYLCGTRYTGQNSLDVFWGDVHIVHSNQSITYRKHERYSTQRPQTSDHCRLIPELWWTVFLPWDKNKMHIKQHLHLPLVDLHTLLFAACNDFPQLFQINGLIALVWTGVSETIVKSCWGKRFRGGVTRLEFLWSESGRERLRVPLEYRFSTSTEKYSWLKIE